MKKPLQKIRFSALILSISFLLSLVCLPVYAENDRESYYRSAKELLFSRQFEEAIDLFDSLDNYADSRSLSEYARFYLDTEPEFGDAFLSDNYIRKTYKAGKLYSLSNYGKYRNCSIYKGDIYVPDSINADTSFVQYFCRGGEGEDYLWYRGMYDYFETYSPNAIIVFTNESGTLRIPQRLSFQ